MAFYLLETSREDQFGVPPFLVTNQERVETRYYQDKILRSQFYESKEVIQLHLTDMDDDRAMILRDFHRWDLGRPNAFILPVSNQFESVLEQLVLPEHQFYPSQVYIEEEEKEHEYFIGHFIFDYLNHIDFSKSTFHISTRAGNILVEAFEQGKVQSLEEFSRLNKEAINQKKTIYANGKELQVRCFLKPIRIQFKQGEYFDVWELRGQAIVSEKAKKVIEAAGITGVAMPKVQEEAMFKELEIVMGEK